MSNTWWRRQVYAAAFDQVHTNYPQVTPDEESRDGTTVTGPDVHYRAVTDVFNGTGQTEFYETIHGIPIPATARTRFQAQTRLLAYSQGITRFKRDWLE